MVTVGRLSGVGRRLIFNNFESVEAAVAVLILCCPCNPSFAIGIVNLVLYIVIIISLFFINAPFFSCFFNEKGNN